MAKALHDKQPRGLMQTLEAMGLVWQGMYYREIDDAKNVVSIVKEIA
jgi:inhibitor of KinA sporulation pathway (predicted exonuclease)